LGLLYKLLRSWEYGEETAQYLLENRPLSSWKTWERKDPFMSWKIEMIVVACNSHIFVHEYDGKHWLCGMQFLFIIHTLILCNSLFIRLIKVERFFCIFRVLWVYLLVFVICLRQGNYENLFGWAKHIVIDKHKWKSEAGLSLVV